MKIHVIVPVYNRPDLLERCLESLAAQDSPADEVFITDDWSTETETRQVIERWAVPRIKEGWGFLWRSLNVGATRNIVEAIRSRPMDGNDVILLVDGDDRLAHPGVIGRLREVYDDPHVLASYGSYDTDPPDPGCPPAKRLPRDILGYGMARAFTRDHGQWFNHPLSFRRRVFNFLDDDDFMIDGEWMRYGYDVTLFVPILEIVGKRVEFVDEVLYTYTSDRDESVFRAYPTETSRENDWVTSRPRKRYPI